MEEKTAEMFEVVKVDNFPKIMALMLTLRPRKLREHLADKDKNHVHTHIIFKLQNIKKKEKILKEANRGTVTSS
jgi:hypothetical protein